MKSNGAAYSALPPFSKDSEAAPKILITEDEYIVAFDLQTRLNHLGYNVVGLASSGDDAILQVNDKHPDLVLMDIVLHGDMDGIETARHLQETCDVPVIFLTANGDSKTLERAGAIHPFSCLLKPFKERELRMSIDMALHHHQMQQQLKKAHDELENRVEERTAELAASNDALRSELERHQKTLSDLREAQVLAKSAERAKSEFLATVSHELITPMNGIVGTVNLLLEEAVLPKEKEQLEVIQSSAESLLAIINDLLNLSNIEKGTLSICTEAFSLKETVETYLRPFAARAKEKGLGFTWSFDPNLPARLVSDHVRIGQALANLTNNAVKFTERGEIKIQVREVAAEKNRVRLCFAVQDTGIGIAEDKQKLIFEPFVQADSSFSRKYGGAGLGLSIANRIALLMGGAISVESKLGHGSTFRFELWADRVG